jgi:hypothetical protein
MISNFEAQNTFYMTGSSVPSPLTGEGKGEGDSLELFPPHLNPLPPGERRLFFRKSGDQNSNEFREVKRK